MTTPGSIKMILKITDMYRNDYQLISIKFMYTICTLYVLPER